MPVMYIYDFFLKTLKNFELFEIADYESEFRILKLKMADKLTNLVSFFKGDYVTWKNFVPRSVYSKIMYLERVNVIEKLYANEF